MDRLRLSRTVDAIKNTDPTTKTIIALDGVSLGISALETLATVVIDAPLIVAGCTGAALKTAGISCGLSLTIAWAVDTYMSGSGPANIGLYENLLGFASLGLTYWSDKDNNLSYDQNGNLTSVTIGKDTVIAARNTMLGVIPESLVDLGISTSQFKYDIDRVNNIKSGGPLIMGRVGGMTANEGWKLLQVLFAEW